jgi:hypothetical protein
VHDDDARQLGRSSSRLANVRREDRLWTDLVIAEEPIRSLELGMCLRKAVTGTVTRAVSELPEPLR